MKQIPIYVLTGFLSTGKTHWANTLLSEVQDMDAVFVQWEEGMQEANHRHIVVSQFTKDTPIEALEVSAQSILDFVEKRHADAIVMEWNGMMDMYLMEHFLSKTSLGKIAYVAHVFYVTNEHYQRNMMGRTGDANLSQLAAADAVLYSENMTKEDVSHVKQYRKDISYFKMGTFWKEIAGALGQKKYMTRSAWEDYYFFSFFIWGSMWGRVLFWQSLEDMCLLFLPDFCCKGFHFFWWARWFRC